MMPTFDLHQSVGQLVTQHPQLMPVLEELKIDYCCHGNRTLRQACLDTGYDPAAVVELLRAALADRPEPGPEPDWSQQPLAELCNHIEQTHHAFLRKELPRLAELIAKVVPAHQARHPELDELACVFTGMRAELETHMLKEERILFPAIRCLEMAERPLEFPFDTVAQPIRVMEQEHESAGRALARLRQLTGDYGPPDDACPAYRALLAGLRELEQDLHRHIHKENNILFPRALDVEMKPQMPPPFHQPLV